MKHISEILPNVLAEIIRKYEDNLRTSKRPIEQVELTGKIEGARELSRVLTQRIEEASDENDN